MTHFFGLEKPFDLVHDLGRRWAFGLIDQQNTALGQCHTEASGGTERMDEAKLPKDSILFFDFF